MARLIRRACWWDKENSESERANAMCQHVQDLLTIDLSWWRQETVRFQQYYAGSLNLSGTQNLVTAQEAKYNIVKPLVDTGVSILTAARTLPYYDSRGGDFKLRQKMKNCNQVLQTQFQDIGVFEQTQMVIKDALVSRLGVLKFFSDPTKSGGTPSCKRMLPLSVVWDPKEAIYGQPGNFFERGIVSKDWLAKIFPAHAEAIMTANGPSEFEKADFALEFEGTDPNQCLVYEGWHLPSSAEAGDGYHMWCVPGAILHQEEWKSAEPPFAFMHGWQPNVCGFAGQSLVEHIIPHQNVIIDAVDAVRRNQKGSNGFIMVFGNDTVEPEQITNEPLKVLRIKNGNPATAPQFVKAEMTLSDVQAQIDIEYARCKEMFGFSGQQTSGEKPAGVSSAVGLRTVEDIQSKRHVDPIRYVETFYTDAAKCLINLNRALCEDKAKAGFKINYRSRKNFIEQAKWSEMDPGVDLKVACFPISQLAGSPASQQETLQGWVKSGWCDETTAKMLQLVPDMEGQTNQDTVDERYAYDQIEDILEGQQIAVSPYQNLKVLAKALREQYIEAKMVKAPKEILLEFERVMGSLKNELAPAPVATPQAATVEQMPLVANSMPPPGAPPMAPPPMAA